MPFVSPTSGHKRIRGPVFTVLGTFVLVYSTAMMVHFNQSASYLFLTAASLAMAITSDLGIRRRESIYGILFLAVSGTLLAADATLVMTLFPDATAASYALIAISGSLLVLRGVHDLEESKLGQRVDESRLMELVTP